MRKMKLLGCMILVQTLILPAAHAYEMGFFGDVSYTDTSGGADRENGAFVLGQFDIYATAQLTDNTRAFVEYVIEHDGEGWVLDLERLYIKRQINDSLNVAMGRFHTPLGMWNSTFHHGSLLFDTASRPEFLDFEDGEGAVLPTHVVGLMFDGGLVTKGGEIGYEAFIANGPSIDTSIAVPGEREIEMNNVGDPNQNKTVGARIVYSFDNVPLNLGVFLMKHKVADTNPASLGETLVDQTITGLEFNYQRDAFGANGEYYRLSNKDETGSYQDSTGTGYYAQFGYQLSDPLKAVYRYESTDFDTNDPYANLLGKVGTDHHVAGLRYELDPTNVLKLELRRSKPEGGDASTTYTVQWSFMMH